MQEVYFHPIRDRRVLQRLGISEANSKFSTRGEATSGSHLFLGFANSALLDPFHELILPALFTALLTYWIIELFIVIREVCG
jgi:hypothetical protein